MGFPRCLQNMRCTLNAQYCKHLFKSSCHACTSVKSVINSNTKMLSSTTCPIIRALFCFLYLRKKKQVSTRAGKNKCHIIVGHQRQVLYQHKVLKSFTGIENSLFWCSRNRQQYDRCPSENLNNSPSMVSLVDLWRVR